MHPKEFALRDQDKFHYRYPGGEVTTRYIYLVQCVEVNFNKFRVTIKSFSFFIFLYV